MRVVKVMAGPHDRKKLREGVAAFGKRVGTRSSVAPGRQVSGVDNERASPAGPLPRNPGKLRAAAEVAARIDPLRLPEERVMARSPYSGGSAEVGAIVAIVTESRVDDIAAFSH